MSSLNAKQSLYRSVDRLRDRLGIEYSAYPVNYQEIVPQKINIQIRDLPFRTRGLNGIANIGEHPEPDIILLNSNRSTIEQRFDFSHELYHCAYHRRSGQVVFGCYESSPPQQNPFLEWQANEAAAEMILPYRSFIPLIASCTPQRSKTIDISICTLAKKFCVTQHNVKIRIKSLKYEIYQYLEGVPLDQLCFLTRREQERRGIYVESLLDLRSRIKWSEQTQPQKLLDPCYGSYGMYSDFSLNAKFQQTDRRQ